MKNVCPLILLLLATAFGQTERQNEKQSEKKMDNAAAAQKALATISGQLKVPGLAQTVKVLRDRWGVAHIYAQNQHDLFFAQGVVAAQDRLFQMEMWKRAGQGRLAEVVGPKFLPRDINARSLRYRGDMQAEYDSYSPDTLSILTAFTDGINAYISRLGAPGGPGMPLEFQLAGFTPDAWRPEDCLNRMAAFSMTGNAFSELQHAEILSQFGAQTAAQLFDFDPAVSLDPDPQVDLTGLSPQLLKDLVGSDQRIQFPPAVPQESNNWTISGALTSTGKPLLANDPHRVMALPSLRYMVHLVAPGWNVIGAGEPGLPGVALGHNERIAWGFTIFGLDQQDLYVEELNPANSLEYKTENGWEKMKVVREKVLMKGAAPAEVNLKFTCHGPVLWQDGKRALALRWVGSEPGTAGYLGSLAIDRAGNWEQFEQAIQRWKVPSENIVYADSTGNIGEHSAGLAPIRSWAGLLPVSGNGHYDWQGFIPSADLPHFFNPAEGFVATANHKMIPEHYPYKAGYEWASPYRVNRIRSVIENAKERGHKLTLADMQSLQTDVTSLPALAFQKLLVSSDLKDDPGMKSFMTWDGRLTRESSDAALYEVWFRQIRVRITERVTKSLNSGFQKLGGRYEILSPEKILALLSNPEKDLFGENPHEERDRLLKDTLRQARAELQKLLGPAPEQWSWGKLHAVSFRHALDERPGMKNLFDPPPLARPGDEYTVNATGVPQDSWQQISGASYREILDTSDWDQSLAVNAPGQSGQPGSPHYSDLLGLWNEGKYFPLVYSQKAVEHETTDRMVLEPR
jgi:penicillin amidase